MEDLDTERKNRLQKKHIIEFKENVIPEEILPYLTCLSNSVKERIRRKQNNDGPQDAAYQLSFDLPRYDDWFEQLIPALRKIGLNKLAERLDDPKVERPGVRQNGPGPDPNFIPGNNRQTEYQGKGAHCSPHQPHHQRAPGYPTVQNEEQAAAAPSEVSKLQKVERITGDTLYRQLPATALNVLRLLDVPGTISPNDWKGLAGYFGYNIESVERLKLEKSPTEALLMEWGILENATLNTLMEALKAIEREDVHSQLQRVLGFHVKGFDQTPQPISPPSPKLDLASGEAKVAIKKPPGKLNDEPRDSSSAANQTGESVADGDKQQKNLNNDIERNAGNSRSDSNDTGSSGQVEAKESNKDCLVTDQVGTGQCSGSSEAPGATTCASKPIPNGGKSKSETRNKNDTLDQDLEPENKNATSEGGSSMNNLNRNPHKMKQNITSDQQYVEDNLRESDQQNSNMTMSNETKMVAGDTGEGDKNTASINYNLDRHVQADENCTGKSSLASTSSSSNNDMSTLYSVTGPDDILGSLKNPDISDEFIKLELSLEGYPSISSDADDSKSLETVADSQSAAMTTRGSTSTQNTTGKDKPSSSAVPMCQATPSPSATAASSVTPSPSARSTLAVTPSPARSTLSATPSPSATSDLKASSTHQVIPTPDTRGSDSPHKATHVPKPDGVQKSMKGTPVTQPAHMPADVPGGLKTPSVDGTFSEDSLMIAITPGRMLCQSQTASTQEAAGKLQQSSFDAKQAASGTQHSPHNMKHNLPSDNISTNSPPTSPQRKDVTMSEDDPSPECQENAAPVPPEIAEPQGRSVLGSVFRAGPVLLSIASVLRSGDLVSYNN